MKEGTFKIPLYWGELLKNLEYREVGIIFKLIFACASDDTLMEQAKHTRNILTSVSDEAVRVCDICLEDVRYQKEHPHSYRKPEERTAIRNSGEYATWRKTVYERDKYTCQICGYSGGRLNAHHIKPFARYPALRLDINNGITLCEKCHKNVHKRGFKNA